MQDTLKHTLVEIMSSMGVNDNSFELTTDEYDCYLSFKEGSKLDSFNLTTKNFTGMELIKVDPDTLPLNVILKGKDYYIKLIYWKMDIQRPNISPIGAGD